MAITAVAYTGNGSNKLFSITFPYLETTDIVVFLNNTQQTITTQYFFANASTIQFVTAPANGATIQIERFTEETNLQATFFAGSSIKAADLNDDFTQMLFSVQEIRSSIYDSAVASGTAISTANAALPKAGGTMTGAIVLPADPSTNLQAATKQYVDAVGAGAAGLAVLKTGGTMTGNLVFAAGQPTATTSTKNIVQLTDSAASTSTTTAATPAAVKVAKDAADAAQATATAALPKSGGTMTGAVVFDLATQQKATTSTYGITQLTNSTTSTDTGTAATAASAKAAADLANAAQSTANTANTTANAALPKAGGTMTGNLEIGTAGSLTFEGATADGFETTLAVVDPTADRTITLPNVTGTVVTTGDTGTVTSTMIQDGTILDGDINASAAIVDTKLATIATAGKVSNSATTATNANTASAIVARDASGNFSAGTITASLTGNASTVTTNANLTGDVTSVGNATAIAAGVIVDADVNASAAIVDTKLATISTAGKVSNSATTAASANTASAIVARDASGNFTAGTITAALTGAASSNVLKAGDTMTGALVVPAGTDAANGIQVGTGTTYKPGIYSPAADQLAISTNGVERVEFGTSEVVFNDGGTNYDFRIEGDTKANLLFVDASADRVSIGSDYAPSAGPDTTLSVYGTPDANYGNASFVDTTSAAVDVGGSITLVGYKTAQSARGTFGLIKGGKENATSGNEASYLAFHTNNNTAVGERMRITSGGLVGLGTSSPNVPLQVIGSSTVTDPVIRATNSGGTQSMALMSGGLRMDGGAPIQIYQGGSEVARIDTSGRLGIGTTNPGAQNTASVLVVGNTSQNNGITILTGTSNDGVLNFNDGENTNLRGYLIYEHSTDSLRFGANGSERGRFDSSGRLLVGHSSAQGQSIFQAVGNSSASTDPGDIRVIRGLSVASVGSNVGAELGIIKFGALESSVCAQISAVCDANWSASDTPGRLVFSTTPDGLASPTERMRITNGGDFYFNATVTTKTTDGFRIENSGQPNISRGSGGTFMSFFNSGSGSQIGSISNTAGTATAYNTTSDYRLKENVIPLVGAINRFNNLQVRRFNFIANPDHTVDGFIAHEAQAVVPECVTGEKDDVDDDGNPVYQGIDQSKLVPLLTAALQEAIAKIEALETRLSALEAA